MGVVYKARQVALNRLTALKMILSGAHAGADEIHRFRTEAEAIARLQHPNIVQIYEVGDRNGLPFFSLEYVDGGSLQAKLDGSPMSPRAAAGLIAKLARALDYAHQRGIVHRDIKPANILLMADGTPKITDFGLAKRLEAEGEGHTATGSILGTPSYMAPEQASGKTNEIGPRTDVYALGAMLYEMLSGRPPFRGETVIHTLQLVQSVEPVPPSRLQPRVPQDLETICLKCLQKESPKRFTTAGELADDLESFLAGQPIKARRTPLWERGWKWRGAGPAWRRCCSPWRLSWWAAFLACSDCGSMPSRSRAAPTPPGRLPMKKRHRPSPPPKKRARQNTRPRTITSARYASFTPPTWAWHRKRWPMAIMAGLWNCSTIWSFARKAARTCAASSGIIWSASAKPIVLG